MPSSESSVFSILDTRSRTNHKNQIFRHKSNPSNRMPATQSRSHPMTLKAVLWAVKIAINITIHHVDRRGEFPQTVFADFEVVKKLRMQVTCLAMYASQVEWPPPSQEYYATTRTIFLYLALPKSWRCLTRGSIGTWQKAAKLLAFRLSREEKSNKA